VYREREFERFLCFSDKFLDFNDKYYDNNILNIQEELE